MRFFGNLSGAIQGQILEKVRFRICCFSFETLSPLSRDLGYLLATLSVLHWFCAAIRFFHKGLNVVVYGKVIRTFLICTAPSRGSRVDCKAAMEIQ